MIFHVLYAFYYSDSNVTSPLPLTNWTATQGENITFLCTTDSLSGITWLKNGGRFQPDVVQVEGLGSISAVLSLSNVVASDAGSYSCVEDGSGHVHNVTLTVVGTL